MKRFAVPVLIIAALVALAIWGARQKAPGQAVQTILCPDPVAGCSFMHKGMPARLRFSTQPVALKPFMLSVASPNLRKAAVSFQMSGMDMGFNRYELKPGPDGWWSASITLPVCTVSRVDWIVHISLDEQVYGLDFSTK